MVLKMKERETYRGERGGGRVGSVERAKEPKDSKKLKRRERYIICREKREETEKTRQR